MSCIRTYKQVNSSCITTHKEVYNPCTTTYKMTEPLDLCFQELTTYCEDTDFMMGVCCVPDATIYFVDRVGRQVVLSNFVGILNFSNFGNTFDGLTAKRSYMYDARMFHFSTGKLKLKLQKGEDKAYQRISKLNEYSFPPMEGSCISSSDYGITFYGDELKQEALLVYDSTQARYFVCARSGTNTNFSIAELETE